MRVCLVHSFLLALEFAMISTNFISGCLVQSAAISQLGDGSSSYMSSRGLESDFLS